MPSSDREAALDAFEVEDQEAVRTFFSYPAEHWTHLRTTNLIESPLRRL